MPRRSFSSRRRSAPRRKLVWARQNVTGAAEIAIAPGTAAPARNDLLLEFEQSLGASSIGCTVARIRGYVSIFDADPVAGQLTQARFTVYVGDNNDIDRAPDANDNSFDQLSQNRDFFCFEPFVLENEQRQPNGWQTNSRLIDVKSSRKLEELNQTLVADLSAFSPNSTAVTNLGFTYDLSVLLMLP